MGTSIFKIELKIMSGEKIETPMIRIRFLKRRRREVKVDPHFVTNGRRRRKFLCLEVNGRRRRKRRFPCLEANGMFQAWWLMEFEGKILFHFFLIFPQPIYLNFQFFLLTLRFCFTTVLGHYSCISFLSLIYKL
jgi:hypothetical protein